MNLCFAMLLFFFGGNYTNGVENVTKYRCRPMIHIDDHMQGIWKMAEDTNYHNYFILEKESDTTYSITYMNKGGDNRGLEHGIAFFSEVNGVKFLSVSNWAEGGGFVILRVKEIGRGSWEMTAALVTDPTLHTLHSSAELRAHLEKNLNNSSFYSLDLHFRKKFEFNSFR